MRSTTEGLRIVFMTPLHKGDDQRYEIFSEQA